MAREQKLIKVCLVNRGQDSETPWAHDLGPAKTGPKGSRTVRLANVPFLHAKPTWGDTIVVSPVEDGLLTWDSGGVPWSRLHTRIEKDGGRWPMIVDYVPHDPSDGETAFQTLHDACVEQDVVCEGAWGPEDGKPGRAYFAVPDQVEDRVVMSNLEQAALPCDLTQIHPTPKKATAKATSTTRAAKPTMKATKSTSKPKATAKAKPKAAAKAKPAAKTKSKAKAATKAKAKPAAKSAAKTKAKAAAKTKTKTKTKAKPAARTRSR